MARGGGGQGIDRLDDAMHRGVSTDGLVRAHHVVVDGADCTSDDQLGVGLRLLLADLAVGQQLLEQARPLGAEDVGTGQGAVAPDDDQPIDAPLDQVAGRSEPALTLPEIGRARGPDHRAAQVHDGADRVPGEPLDAIPTVDQALQPLVHGVRVGSLGDRRADHGPHCRIHPLRVTPGRQDCQGLAAFLGRGHANLPGRCPPSLRRPPGAAPAERWAHGTGLRGQPQPRSWRRSSWIPKWWATSWTTVIRTSATTSARSRHMARMGSR